MAKGQSLQDPFLNALRKERVPVSIYLVNGIKLQGQIDSFDQFVVLLRNSVSQMVYKHAISTVVPARNVRLATEEGAPAETASCLNSSRSSGSIGAPKPKRTNTARSPVRGRSNTQASRGRGHYSAGVSAAAPSSVASRTLRAGTTVEIACL